MILNDNDQPVIPWPDDWAPITAEEAAVVVAAGTHRGAIEGGRDIVTDLTILGLIGEGLVASAFKPDGTLMFAPTRLAQKQQLN